MSAQLDEPRGGAGRGTLAVGLAIVFLAVIGASVGVILGQAAQSGESNSGSGSGSPTPNGSVITATEAPRRSPTPRASATRAASPSCPDVMEQSAKAAGSPGGMKLVRYYETNTAEVWICRDSGNKLWYQGHKKIGGPNARYPDEDLVQWQNALLVKDVKALGNDTYQATNTDPKTGEAVTYTVSRDVLAIASSSASPSVPAEKQPVIRTLP